MGMERIQHAADVDQQRVVVRPALACAGQHGLEAAGLGCGRATHVERMHHGSQARETPIVLQAEARQQYLERHRSEEHTSELQSRQYLVCRLLLEKKKKKNTTK